MNRSVAEALQDVRDHAARGRAHVRNVERVQLDAPGLERDAFLYCLIAIGEALKQVPAAVLSAEPAVPWQAVVATRNYLAHNHWEIDGGVLWRIAQTELGIPVEAVGRLAARFGDAGP